MGALIGRKPGWRPYVALAAALIAVLVTFFSTGRTARLREEEPRKRLVDADEARLGDFARTASLWLEGCRECVVPALYGVAETARFSAVLSWAPHGAGAVQAPPSASPVDAMWARLAAVYGPGADGQAMFTPGEPAIVSIRSSAIYAPLSLAA